MARRSAVRVLREPTYEPLPSEGSRLALVVQVALAIAGFASVQGAMRAPSAVHFVSALVGCGLVPAILYFRSLHCLRDLPTRVGTSLILTIAAWTILSTVVLGADHDLSSLSARVILGLVYVSGIVAYLLLRLPSGRRPRRSFRLQTRSVAPDCTGQRGSAPTNPRLTAQPPPSGAGAALRLLAQDQMADASGTGRSS